MHCMVGSKYKIFNDGGAGAYLTLGEGDLIQVISFGLDPSLKFVGAKGFVVNLLTKPSDRT